MLTPRRCQGPCNTPSHCELDSTTRETSATRGGATYAVMSRISSSLRFWTAGRIKPNGHNKCFVPLTTSRFSHLPTIFTSCRLISEVPGNYSGLDLWSLEGFDLKGAISVLYNINPVRIALPTSLDGRTLSTATQSSS